MTRVKPVRAILIAGLLGWVAICALRPIHSGNDIGLSLDCGRLIHATPVVGGPIEQEDCSTARTDQIILLLAGVVPSAVWAGTEVLIRRRSRGAAAADFEPEPTATERIAGGVAFGSPFVGLAVVIPLILIVAIRDRGAKEQCWRAAELQASFVLFIASFVVASQIASPSHARSVLLELALWTIGLAAFSSFCLALAAVAVPTLFRRWRPLGGSAAEA
ncbi:hypothetical protein [Marmoricola sp. RAF53]|uniref:hypothetical protein n=1 Tax=Marmoricola sp. RAF53 TaxID=3233059 RepID=UPI003F98E605